MNYKKVIEDFNSGVLDKKTIQLVMDNDSGYWLCIDGNLSEDDQDDISDQLKEKYGTPNGYHDIVDVLNAAGVNCDWC